MDAWEQVIGHDTMRSIQMGMGNVEEIKDILKNIPTKKDYYMGIAMNFIMGHVDNLTYLINHADEYSEKALIIANAMIKAEETEK